MVIALIVTPDGFPLAYEVLNGNTSDKTTLPDFLKKIEAQYGKAQRIWVMDRGVPTEKILKEMRSQTPVSVSGRDSARTFEQAGARIPESALGIDSFRS